MNRSYERLVRCALGLLAIALVCLPPSAVRADNVVFRNECKSSVVVQTAYVVKGVLQRDTPQMIRPGDYTEAIPTNVDRIITVSDARSNRVLYSQVYKAARIEAGFAIVPDPQMPNKVRMVQRKANMKGP